MQHHILINLCALFGVASIVVVICNYLKIRYIIGYLITGVLLSPNTSSLFADMEEVEIYSEIGIILLLFTVGLEFSFSNLRKIQKYVLQGGAAQVFFTIILTSLLIYLFMRPSPAEAVFWGFLYALSSTAIVIKTLQDSNKITSAHGKIVLAMLLFQDVMIVPLMLLTPLLAGQGGNPGVELALLFGKLALMGGFAFLLAKYLIPYFLKTIMKVQSQEVFLIATMFLVTGISLVTEKMGLSLALGAFIAGLIIAETDYSRMAITCFLPFRYVFMSFFFISMGMLLDYKVFLEEAEWVAFWFFFSFLVKTVAAALAAKTLKVPTKTAIATGLSIAQIGEFSFVLAQSGLQFDLISERNYQIFLAVSILMMSITPVVVVNAERIASFIQRKKAI